MLNIENSKPFHHAKYKNNIGNQVFCMPVLVCHHESHVEAQSEVLAWDIGDVIPYGRDTSQWQIRCVRNRRDMPKQVKSIQAYLVKMRSVYIGAALSLPPTPHQLIADLHNPKRHSEPSRPNWARKSNTPREEANRHLERESRRLDTSLGEHETSPGTISADLDDISGAIEAKDNTFIVCHYDQ